ncbi:sel1 repeat family protein [Pseudomonas amygdali pv. lachrymans]|uniref:Sel1 repeat-containing protein n=3 Tax=Pseudomonas amygdali TaxID=47877 RepID=A0ABR5KYC8_PSEAV|nr:sel1 repeat family protein [Pseudomonas amygdali]AXH54102.1 sel1 repeat family protein [Pseudomonas amygdali pv. lachrymans str. M301315]KPC19837.1 Sel1 repeat-containing protein [Pseudomonas amygdali pv. lachrymans]QWA49911.1 sel1 repeat family protein [Pseudomonas amygdali pv. lachrymans]RMT03550.1 Sel1 repeat-containing protein [Pseudomonas amygdali pv. lachrymans]
MNTLKTLISALIFVLFSSELNAMQKDDRETVKSSLKLECHRESDILPNINQEADILYKYGLFLQTKEGPKDFNDVARYYRIAAAHGHYKAATNLQALITQGLASSTNGQKETIELVEKFMNLGVPGAYYDMGHYLEAGYGVEQDQEKANAYFRKAADLGSPDAQYYVATLLGRVKGGVDIMEQMLHCAAYQGHASAARELAGYIRESKKFKEAVLIYQISIKAGDSASARRLSKAFEGPPPTEELYYLGVDSDKERADRYRLISKFLKKNEQLGSKLPDIDSIVPLPPAKLPAWDGTFQWQKKREAEALPKKPDNILIQRLSKDKNLDFTTGLPLSSG